MFLKLCKPYLLSMTYQIGITSEKVQFSLTSGNHLYPRLLLGAARRRLDTPIKRKYKMGRIRCSATEHIVDSHVLINNLSRNLSTEQFWWYIMIARLKRPFFLQWQIV